MKPNQLDLQVWQAVRSPSWAFRLLKDPPRVVPVLHAAINSHGQTRHARYVKNERTREKSNAVAVLRMVRRRGEDVCVHMADAIVRYAKLQPARVVTYRRWLRQIERRRMRA